MSFCKPNPAILRAGHLRALLLLLAAMALLLPSPATLAQAARQSPAPTSLTGEIKDASGASLADVTVTLTRRDGRRIASTLSNAVGHFALPQPAPGDYRLTAALPEFTPLVRDLHLAAGESPPLELTLKLKDVATSVTVHADAAIDLAAPEENKDAVAVSSDDLKTLPMLDGDPIATLSAFLDAGVAGEGGATLIVDGVESKTVGVAPSAIERVSINQDPYSATYYTPGRGQIEIVTKGAADHFHGSASFTFRDAALDASNYFATLKPPEQRRVYEGYLTGPIRPLRDTAFLFSLTRQEEDVYNQVLANVLPVPTPAQNIAAPTRSTVLTMRVGRQYNAHHSGYAMYRFNDSSETNQSVGGLTLPAAGYTYHEIDQDIRYHDDLILGASRLNQFQLLFEHNFDRSSSTTGNQSPKVIVQGIATFGGAQSDLFDTENNPNLNDIFSWSFGGAKHATHQMKFGVQLPNMGRRVLEDRTDWQGTYTFAGLSAYQANAPTTFAIQQGQYRWLTYHLQPGSFVQDQIQATERLTVTAGLRYDWQNALPGTMDAVQPRLSLAYLVDSRHGLVIRTGGGIYVRRVGFDVLQRLTRYEHAGERNLLLTSNLCYPDITACNNLAAQPPSLFNYQPNLKSPAQGYFGLSAEREIVKGAVATLGYSGFRGWHALRSIDINAPPPPFTGTQRPNPAYAQVMQLNSGGYQKSDSFNATLRGRIGRYWSGLAQYVWQHADSDTEWSSFNAQNQYDPNAEWSRAATDQRHKLSMLGTFYPAKPFNFGFGFYANTPLPYTVITGSDDFHDGLSNARPAGVPRNSLNGGGYEDLELRAGYTRRLRPRLKEASPAIALSLSTFNTLNGVNFQSYDRVVSSPLFRQPTTSGPGRRLQLAAGYTF